MSNWQQACGQGIAFDPPQESDLLSTGIMFKHKERQREVRVDRRVIQSGRFYCPPGSLYNFLEGQGVKDLAHPDKLITLIEQSQLVCGISGFATKEKDYTLEGTCMEIIFEAFKAAGVSLIVDGGAAAGILGLSSLLARKCKIESLGVTPLNGLKSFGPRNYHLMRGNSYSERQDIIGVMSRVLVCIGGGDGTRDEAIAAIRAGNIVVVVAPKDYGPELFCGSYTNDRLLQDAEQRGRLLSWVRSDGNQKLREIISQAARAALQRPKPISTLRPLLNSA